MWSKASFQRWLAVLRTRLWSPTRQARPIPRFRLGLEGLELRSLPSITALATPTALATAAQLEVFGPTGQKNGPLAAAGSDLAYLYEQYLNFTAVSGQSAAAFQPSDPLLQVTNGLVAVEVLPASNASTTAANLATLGFQLTDESTYDISGYLPITALPAVAALPSVAEIEPSYTPIYSTGPTTSQGTQSILSNQVNQYLGIDGTGVTVGVVSDSFDALGGYASDASSGALPGPGNPYGQTTPVNVIADASSGTDEGRAMLQIVHDVAPGADLAFATAGTNQQQMADNIKALANAGTNVIVDDVTFPAEPMFQDGVIAQAVENVVAAGVTYVSAAGNLGHSSYQAPFNNSGTNIAGTGAWQVPGTSTFIAQNFAPAGQAANLYQTVTIGPGATTLSFQWSDPFLSVSGGSGAQSDLDIAAFDTFGNYLTGSFNRTVGGDPVQLLTLTNPNATPIQVEIAIGKYAGPDPSLLKYVAFGSGFSVDTFATNSSTVYGHANAAGAIGVGAANYSQTPAYGVSPPVLESFSSVGGTPILFDTSGNPIPSITRQSPAVVGPDGVNTTFFGTPNPSGSGFPIFVGTSAAAAHVAGVAALLLQANSSLTPTQVTSALESTAIPMGSPPGYNTASGYGLVQALPAVLSVGGPFTVTFDGTVGGDTMVVRRDTSGTNVQFLLGGMVQFSIPFANLGQIDVNGEGGADILTVDYSNGNPIPSGGLVYAGESLDVTGYSVGTLTVSQTGSETGTVSVGTGSGSITFSQTTLLTVDGTAANLIVDLPAGANPNTVVSDDGGANDPAGSTPVPGLSAVAGSTFAYTRFAAPTNSLTVNLGNSGNTVTVEPMDAAFDPVGPNPFTIVGGSGADTFTIAPDGGSPVGGDVTVPVTVVGNGSASDALTFQGGGGAIAINLGAGTITEAGGAEVAFSGIETVTVDAAGAAVAATGTYAAETYQVTPAENGTGSLRVTANRIDLTATDAMSVTLDGGGVGDTLQVVGGSASDQFTINATASESAGVVEANGSFPVTFDDLGTGGVLSLVAAGGGTQFTVNQALDWGIATVDVMGGTLSVNGTTSDDLFSYTPGSSVLAVQTPLGGPTTTTYHLLSVQGLQIDGNGQTLADRLVVTDANVVQPTAGSGSIGSGLPIQYRNIEQVVDIGLGSGVPIVDATTPDNVPVAIDILDNVTLFGSAPLTLSIDTPPAYGSAAVVGNTIFYTPVPGGNGGTGPVVFTYTVTAGQSITGKGAVGQQLATGTVTVVVNSGTSPPPTATPQSATITGDVPTNLTLGATDTYLTGGQVLTYAIASLPADGTLSGFDASTGQVTYTPNAGYAGSDSFTFTVSEGTGNSITTSSPAEVTLQVDPLSPPPLSPPPPPPPLSPPPPPPPITATVAPVAVSQTVTVTGDGSEVITVTATDANPDGTQNLVFTIVSGPTNGTLTPIPGSAAGTAQFLYRPFTTYSGTDSFTFTATDNSPGVGLTSQPGEVSLTITPPPDGIYAVGAGPGGGPEIKVYDAVTGALLHDFYALNPAFRGGVQVAVADVTGDGYPDIIVAAGPSGAPQVQVFSGKDMSLLASFYAFDSTFRGGVTIAAGDVEGNGIVDVVVGAGPGGGPQVRTFQITPSGAVQIAGPLGSFYAYAPSFMGGVNVATGDLNGNGQDEIITGAASLGGPNVKVFGSDGSVLQSFYAFGSSLLGVSVTTADLNGDGKDEIITGPGVGGGPIVQVFDGQTAALLESVPVYNANFRGGIWVATTSSASTGRPAIVVGPETGSLPVELFDGTTFTQLDQLDPYGPAFTGGVSVAGE